MNPATPVTNLSTLRNRNLRLKEAYRRHRFRKKLFVIVLVPIVVALVGSAVAFGSADISFVDVYRTVFRHAIPGDAVEDVGHTHVIVWRLRLPRVLMGLIAGVALGSTGAVMQVVL